MPSEFLDKRKFGLIFDIGIIANLKEGERMKYEASLKHLKDIESANYSAHMLGSKEAEERKNREFVMNLLSANRFSDEEVASFAGVTLSYVQKLREELEQSTN